MEHSNAICKDLTAIGPTYTELQLLPLDLVPLFLIKSKHYPGVL